MSKHCEAVREYLESVADAARMLARENGQLRARVQELEDVVERCARVMQGGECTCDDPWCFGSALRRARAALQPRLDTQKVDFEGVQPGPEAKVPEGWQGSRLFEAAKAMPSSVLVDGGPVERRWTEPTLSKAQLVEAHAEVLKHYMMERRADASGYRVGFAREVLNRVIDALTASHAGEGKPE